jgi:soluble lytic murein transglycosylase-like protein
MLAGLLLVALTAVLLAPVRVEATEGARPSSDALREELETLRGIVADLESQLARMRPALHSFELPEAITFAGEPVPLERWDVGERLEREFYLALAAPAQVVLWLKRSGRYFPYIEARLRAAGLPDDLKYVAVVESALQPGAVSWARATGIWQFIDDTARRYGLRVGPAWDERRDPERSTAAALGYLRDLHARFGDWPLALAGYNAGEQRVTTALRAQGVTDYYRLALPAETERYVFRILAAKLILESPDRYGFTVTPPARYAPHATVTVGVKVAGHLLVSELAAAAGSFYRELRTLNPAITSDRLPPGRYEVRIPEDNRERFQAALPELERVMAARAVRRVTYRVRRGDTLGGIARRFNVPIEALRRRNAAARRAHLRPGDVLVIERIADPE